MNMETKWCKRYVPFVECTLLSNNFYTRIVLSVYFTTIKTGEYYHNIINHQELAVPDVCFVKCYITTPDVIPLTSLTITAHMVINHYDDVIMGAIASQITSLTIVYSTLYSGADQSKHQSSASLAFVRGIHRGPVNSRHKWPVTRKMFPFDDVIMYVRLICLLVLSSVPTIPILPPWYIITISFPLPCWWRWYLWDAERITDSKCQQREGSRTFEIILPEVWRCAIPRNGSQEISQCAECSRFVHHLFICGPEL